MIEYEAVIKYESFIGHAVKKCSTVGSKSNKETKETNIKPFKSGLMINTVKGIINHPQLNVPAFTFVEDDSYVECRRCVCISFKEVTPHV